MASPKTTWVAIAAIIVVIAGWYYISNPIAVRSTTFPKDAATAALGRQGASDEIGAIEADIAATDFFGLDRELKDIDAGLAE